MDQIFPGWEADGHSNYPVVFLFLKVQATFSRKTTRAEDEEGMYLKGEVLDVNFSQRFPFLNFLFNSFIFQMKLFSKCSPLPNGWEGLRCAQGWQDMAVTGQWEMLLAQAGHRLIDSACPGWTGTSPGQGPLLRAGENHPGPMRGARCPFSSIQAMHP